jgi:hypothetical protein
MPSKIRNLVMLILQQDKKMLVTVIISFEIPIFYLVKLTKLGNVTFIGNTANGVV